MPPNLLGLIVAALGASGVVAIIAIAAVKIAKTIAGRGADPAELAAIREQLAEQSEQIAELHERLDFAERRVLGAGGQRD